MIDKFAATMVTEYVGFFNRIVSLAKINCLQKFKGITLQEGMGRDLYRDYEMCWKKKLHA